MAEWLRSRRPHGPQLPAFKIQWLAGPYDVPSAVRCTQETAGKIRFEFRYVDGSEQASDPVVADPYTHVIRGKHSSRILAIEVDLESYVRDALHAQLTGLTQQQFTNIVHELSTGVRKAYKTTQHCYDPIMYEPAMEALRTRENDLYKQFALSSDHS